MPPKSTDQSGRKPWIGRFIFSIVLLVVALLILFNRQYIVDSLTVSSYQPSSEIVALSSTVDFTDHGEFLFYASTPRLSERQEFTDQCGSVDEQTAILGCYAGQKIYLFDVDDERLAGIEEVTAAHEMLHAAYDRMSSDERDKLHKLIDEAYKQVVNDRLKDQVEFYEKTEPGQRYNELFAILGTEYDSLPDELEKIYQRYFSDRDVVVNLADQYQATFGQLRKEQAAIIDQLESLAAQINRAADRYQSQVSSLSRDINNFNNRAQNGDFDNQAEFDAERASLVTRQSELENIRQSIESQTVRYNELKQRLDEINLVAEELNHSINPSLPETPNL